ncbi:MAG: phage portal protein [Desulfobulbaceae bacterium]|nr:phage portal protein [Desulfobulbaceae bacterium]
MTKPTLVDKAIAYFSPRIATSRIRDRDQYNAISGGYHAGSRSRDALTGWTTRTADADTDILADLHTMRDRSRDLVRNNPFGAGAIHTKVTNIVGTGLKLNASIDREYLQLDDEAADEYEQDAERLFGSWSQSSYCDIERTLLWQGHQDLALRSMLENGDHFVIMARADSASPWNMALQHVEADRVSNPDNGMDTETLVEGVEKSPSGAPLRYHISDKHPGSMNSAGMKWTSVPAFGRDTGRRITLHMYRKVRAGQTRGIPDLAPVIETIKQLGRYTEAEIDAAVKTAMWSIIVKTETGDGLAGLDLDSWRTTRQEYYKGQPVDLKGGTSSTVGLFPDDDFQAFDPQRPNSAYEPFINAMIVQIGMALEIPAEVLTKYFQSSYSAARGALIQFGQLVAGRRKWFAADFCQPIYETVLSEAVASGRINAPGFFADPMIRAAYCGAEWVGDAMGQIDETKAVKAATDRIALGVSTRKRETAALTGEDYDRVLKQAEKENRMTGSDQPGVGMDDEDKSAGDMDKDDRDESDG